jgi:trimeric autotransporter adhesin
MANVKAVATGNWSNTATWSGGVLPTSADDVFANGFTVTIDGTFTVLTIRNTSGTGIVAGGQFIYANGGDLTCTADQAIYVGKASVPVLQMTLASPNIATFNGSVLTMTNTVNYIAIRNSGSGTLNLNGNYSIDGSANPHTLISVNSFGTVNIVGDVYSTASGNNINTLLMTASGTINITGNISGAPSTAGSPLTTSTIFISAAGNLNITGNTTASLAPAVYLTGAVNYTQIGNVNASTTQAAIYNASAATTISVTGIITAGTGAPAIYAAFALASGYGSGTFVKVSGNVVNTSDIMAIVAPRVTIDTNTSSWLFQISTGGDRTLYAAGVALGNPVTTDVRLGTVYGASSELTGTLIVPSPSNVLQGVGTDATVGTLLMTPADFWNYLIASGFTANSIGDRLQNASTVATTGGQIASYNI